MNAAPPRRLCACGTQCQCACLGPPTHSLSVALAPCRPRPTRQAARPERTVPTMRAPRRRHSQRHVYVCTRPTAARRLSCRVHIRSPRAGAYGTPRSARARSAALRLPSGIARAAPWSARPYTGTYTAREAAAFTHIQSLCGGEHSETTVRNGSGPATAGVVPWVEASRRYLARLELVHERLHFAPLCSFGSSAHEEHH